MILDDRLELADAALLNTGAAGTYNLGDVIDLQTVRDIGVGQDIYIVITVDTGIAVASGTGTVQFLVASDAQDPFLTNGTATIHAQTPAFATSTTSNTGALRAGTVLFMSQLPIQGNAYERYLGVQQVTGTTAISAGRVNVFLTMDPTRWYAYNDAI